MMQSIKNLLPALEAHHMAAEPDALATIALP